MLQILFLIISLVRADGPIESPYCLWRYENNMYECKINTVVIPLLEKTVTLETMDGPESYVNLEHEKPTYFMKANAVLKFKWDLVKNYYQMEFLDIENNSLLECKSCKNWSNTEILKILKAIKKLTEDGMDSNIYNLQLIHFVNDFNDSFLELRFLEKKFLADKSKLRRLMAHLHEDYEYIVSDMNFILPDKLRAPDHYRYDLFKFDL
ncbi:MAG: hypothetical protein EOP45_08540 [Sphingobacteriaceae bacterium]|nr:MAG: hypothetical protein EOP45_08540 [Sphingobacteriaceae bacterium]